MLCIYTYNKKIIFILTDNTIRGVLLIDHKVILTDTLVLLALGIRHSRTFSVILAISSKTLKVSKIKLKLQRFHAFYLSFKFHHKTSSL